jgi:hypothetical protein
VTVLVFTDYLPVFLLPIFPLYAVLAKIKNRKWWRNLIISFLPLVILGFWWLPTFKIQSLGGKWLLAHLPAWRTIAGGATFKQVALLWIKFCFGRISLVNKSLYYLLIIILSLPFGLLLVKALKSFKQFLFVWLWLAVPVVLSFLVSLFFPAFIYFRFIFVLPAFYLILALGAASCRRMKIKYFLIASVILINLATSAFYLFDSDQHRENWRLATVMIERRLKEKEAAIFVNPEPFAPYRWYSQKANSGLGLLPHIGATGDEINKTTKETIVGLDGLYLFNYLKDLNDPDGSVVSALNQSDFYPKEVLGGFGDVGQVIYLTRKK